MSDAPARVLLLLACEAWIQRRGDRSSCRASCIRRRVRFRFTTLEEGSSGAAPAGSTTLDAGFEGIVPAGLSMLDAGLPDSEPAGLAIDEAGEPKRLPAGLLTPEAGLLTPEAGLPMPEAGSCTPEPAGFATLDAGLAGAAPAGFAMPRPAAAAWHASAIPAAVSSSRNAIGKKESRIASGNARFIPAEEALRYGLRRWMRETVCRVACAAHWLSTDCGDCSSEGRESTTTISYDLLVHTHRLSYGSTKSPVRAVDAVGEHGPTIPRFVIFAVFKRLRGIVES